MKTYYFPNFQKHFPPVFLINCLLVCVQELGGDVSLPEQNPLNSSRSTERRRFRCARSEYAERRLGCALSASDSGESAQQRAGEPHGALLPRVREFLSPPQHQGSVIMPSERRIN
jgi:hypothetical protein